MFFNFAFSLHVLFSLNMNAMQITVDSGNGPGPYAVVSYLDATGKRHPAAPTGILSEAQKTEPASHEVFQIVMHNNTCVSLLLMNKPRSAERACVQALDLADRYNRKLLRFMPVENSQEMLATVHATIGMVYAAMGKDTLASHSLREACRLDANYAAARYNLALIENGSNSYADLGQEQRR